MRTEVNKSFEWGFLLSESELRRVFKTCQEHAQKLGTQPIEHLIELKLKDGSVIKTADLDDIVKLENAGSKKIERLSLNFSDGSDNKEWLLAVQFQDAAKNPKDWTSVDFQVVGNSRDWAQLASADLEERVAKTRKTAWSRVFRGGKLQIFIMIALILGMFAGTSLAPKPEVGLTLRQAYESGEIRDAVQALIFLEEEKSKTGVWESTAPIWLGMLTPVLFLFFITTLLPSIYSPYNFYWGDYIQLYDRRQALIRVFWTVLVFGIIASLIGGLLLQFLIDV